MIILMFTRGQSLQGEKKKSLQGDFLLLSTGTILLQNLFILISLPYPDCHIEKA